MELSGSPPDDVMDLGLEDDEVEAIDPPPAQPVVDQAADKANVVSFLDGRGMQKSGNWEPMAPAALLQKLKAKSYKWQAIFDVELCHVNKRVTTNSLSLMHSTTTIVPVCVLRCKRCRAISSPRNPSDAVSAHKCKGAAADPSISGSASVSIVGEAGTIIGGSVTKRRSSDGGIRSHFISEQTQQQFINEFCMWM